MRLPVTISLLGFSLGLAGCGGAGGEPAPKTPVTVTLLSVEALNGTVGEDGYLILGQPGAGDTKPPGSPEFHFRAFVTFDLSSLPAHAEVLAATLTLHQFHVHGAPYATLGPLLLDQVAFGAILDAGAYDSSFPTSQGITLSTDPSLGPRIVTATTQVRADLLSGRTLSQYRIRFQVPGNGDAIADGVVIGAPGSYGPGYASDARSDVPALSVPAGRGNHSAIPPRQHARRHDHPPEGPGASAACFPYAARANQTSSATWESAMENFAPGLRRWRSSEQSRCSSNGSARATALPAE